MGALLLRLDQHSLSATASGLYGDDGHVRSGEANYRLGGWVAYGEKLGINLE